MKCLTLCPTRARPHRITKMLDTFDATRSPNTDIVFYVANDDPCLEEYTAMLPPDKMSVGPRLDISAAFNFMFQANPGWPYYSITNDDYVYHTNYWDERLMDAIVSKCGGWGIADSNSITFHGNYHEHRHPSGCVISGNIPRTLGHIYHPTINSYRNDTYLRDIAEGIGPELVSHYVYLTDVHIEHEHFSNGKAPHDPTYAVQYEEAHRIKGDALYTTWCEQYRPDDLKKLREAMLREAYKMGFDKSYYNRQSSLADNPFYHPDQIEAWKAGFQQSQMEFE